MRRFSTQSGPGPGLAAGIALILLPAVVRADNLGVLVYPALVWPLEAILGISLVVLGVIGAVKLNKKNPGRGDRTFGKWLVGIALVEAVTYSVLFSLLTEAWREKFPDLTLVSLAPLLGLALACLLLGIALARKSR